MGIDLARLFRPHRKAVARLEPLHDRERLFGSLVVPQTAARKGRPALWGSLAAHALAIVAALLVPLLQIAHFPEQRVDPARVFFYDPPPPPPLPLPKGDPLLPEPADSRRRARRPVRKQDPAPREALAPTDFVAPWLSLPPEVLAEDLEALGTGEDDWGSETGSPFGVPEGMEGGVEGGRVGGVPGGVIGGVVGGRLGGTLVVHDYDRAPRLILQTDPEYPHDAFAKKIQGTVLLQILIDENGRVTEVRVLQSIPLLTQAAIDAVLTWRFRPAIKGGRPVAAIAQAPIRFTIY